MNARSESIIDIVIHISGINRRQPLLSQLLLTGRFLNQDPRNGRHVFPSLSNVESNPESMKAVFVMVSSNENLQSHQ